MLNNKGNKTIETLRVKKLVNRNPHEISGEEIQTSLCLRRNINNIFLTSSNLSLKLVLTASHNLFRAFLSSLKQQIIWSIKLIY